MPRPSPVSPEQEFQIAAQYKSGVSRNKLAIDFDSSRGFINVCLARHGVKTRSLKEACPGLPLRHDAFASAETDRVAAYWVGFLMADGCISEPPNSTPHIIIVLSRKDASHLRMFQAFVGSSHSLQSIAADPKHRYNSGECVRLDLVSARMAADLARYGVIPRKTHIAKVAKSLELSCDFWRGVIDGDGTVRLERERKPGYKPRPILSICGSESLMNQFSDFASSIVQTNAKPHRSKSIWAYTLSCDKALSVICAIYTPNCIALARKAAIAQSLLSR